MEQKLLEVLRREGKPLDAATLFENFEQSEKDDAAAAAEKLLREGRLILTRKRKFALPEQTGLIYGRIQGNARGFAFFLPEDGSPDMFIPADSMHGAMHGDKVYVRPTENLSRNGTAEAEVTLILIRGQSTVVGVFESDAAAGGYVVPDDNRISMDVLIPPTLIAGAKHGDRVVANITQYPDGRRPLMGEVTEIIGGKDEKGTDMLAIIRRLDLPEAFPKTALRQAKALNRPLCADDAAMREDLRSGLVITIDGADAKDLDDAVSLTTLENGGAVLYVHIADVSQYIKEDSLLDKEARRRGTSVYFPDRVLPMFPPAISNGACSLSEGEDKLTLSCIMELDAQGKVISHRLAETVIRSAHRMTYADVNAIFGGDTALAEKYSDIMPMLSAMRGLASKLNDARVKRGSLDFDLDESELTLDSKGRAVGLKAAERGIANKMIEEFMLITNETVAEHARNAGIPFMYRVHEQPDKEKMGDLNAFLEPLGYGIKNLGSIKPATLQRILFKAKGTPEEALVSRVTLRAMKKARYAPDCLGHFGLASECYCHFTSPIRRYPDLTVHRLIKAMLRGELTAERAAKYGAAMEELSKHCSDRELAATEAERAADDVKKCEYMKGRIGTIDTGMITGVAQHGFFVRLSNTAEGMVRAASVGDDYYVCDEKNHRMYGRESGRVFRLGDTVRVRVKNADMETGNIDFELAKGMKGGPAAAPSPSASHIKEASSASPDKEPAAPKKTQSRRSRRRVVKKDVK